MVIFMIMLFRIFHFVPIFILAFLGPPNSIYIFALLKMFILAIILFGKFGYFLFQRFWEKKKPLLKLFFGEEKFKKCVLRGQFDIVVPQVSFSKSTNLAGDINPPPPPPQKNVHRLPPFCDVFRPLLEKRL